jgi:uncharacterized membrane protein YkoI
MRTARIHKEPPMSIVTQIAALSLVFVLTAAATSSALAQSDAGGAQRAPLTVADATRIALARFPGADVLEVEHDTERGREIFEVELRDRGGVEHELVIDATNGLIVEDDD